MQQMPLCLDVKLYFNNNVELKWSMGFKSNFCFSRENNYLVNSILLILSEKTLNDIELEIGE